MRCSILILAFTLAISLAGVTPARGASERVVTEKDRQHWSFRPLQPRLATASGSRLVRRASTEARNPVDLFWLEALAAKGLAPAAELPGEKLIRRLYFDLVGLPPTPEQVRGYVEDRSLDAYERRVDELLASPQFGERWARHWLDLARYADSNGYERDGDRPGAYHYRDFVIRAFNEDVSFQQFIRWQLAGDEYAPTNFQARVATAFLGLGPVVETGTQLKEELERYRFADLDDMLGTTGSAMLGLTIGCARCHDHKYDPIPTRDYYRMLCAFASTERRDLPSPGVAAAATAGPAAAVAVAPALTVTEPGGTPRKNFLMIRGESSRPGPEVQLGFLSVLSGARTPAEYGQRDRSEGSRSTTRQRLALAEWITDPVAGAGALLARVMVNRLWQHHFGEGLVRTPSDFGTQGERPSHPELLDWLADQLIRSGWSLKTIHRLILTSACYRQGWAAPTAVAARVDPDNRLLWRRRPQRIESETLRDSMLAVSGVLVTRQFGPGIKAPIPPELNAAANTKDPYPKDARDEAGTWRRSIYLFTKRSLRQPLLETFDGADPSVSCARRLVTTVAPQGLALLNDSFVRARAVDFASRLSMEAGPERPRQVQRAFRLALGREPSEREQEEGVRFVTSQAAARSSRGEPDAAALALADFCQALFGLNEFVYVD